MNWWAHGQMDGQRLTALASSSTELVAPSATFPRRTPVVGQLKVVTLFGGLTLPKIVFGKAFDDSIIPWNEPWSLLFMKKKKKKNTWQEQR